MSILSVLSGIIVVSSDFVVRLPIECITSWSKDLWPCFIQIHKRFVAVLIMSLYVYVYMFV